jgi:hypothetical protein
MVGKYGAGRLTLDGPLLVGADEEEEMLLSPWWSDILVSYPVES